MIYVTYVIVSKKTQDANSLMGQTWEPLAPQVCFTHSTLTIAPGAELAAKQRIIKDC